MTNGLKKSAKTKSILDPLTVNFQAPVIDFLRRGDDLLRRVIAAECWHPPIHRRPPLNGDDAGIEMDADGFPIMPFLRREVPR